MQGSSSFEHGMLEMIILLYFHHVPSPAWPLPSTPHAFICASCLSPFPLPALRQTRPGLLFFETIPKTQVLLLLSILSGGLQGGQKFRIPREEWKPGTRILHGVSLLLLVHYPQSSKDLWLGRKVGFLRSDKKNNHSYRLLKARYCAKLLTYSTSLNPQNFPLLSPFYR